MKKFLIVAIIVFCAISIGTVVWLEFFRAPQQAACTAEAKLCPDGSYVGRTGPSCEFAQCPEVINNNNGWKTFSDDKQGIAFQYPDQLATTTYIHTVDWPPQVVISGGPFICTEGGSEIAQAGQTQQQIINGRTYCVTKESEGAAGSIYTQYAYSFSKNDKVIIFTFILRSVQCANYDDPQKTQCETERQAFEIDNDIIDRMAQSAVIK